MNLLSRYVLKEMVGPTALGFAFYTSIIVVRQIVELAGMIIKRSLSAEVVGQLLLFLLPSIIVLTVPMSILFGILIAVGRLSADSEIVAMRASGISTRTIYRPVFIFSFAMCALSFFLINYVLPEGNRRFMKLQTELLVSASEHVVKPRVFHDQYENLVIYVDAVDPATGKWKGVFVAGGQTRSENEPLTPRDMARSLETPPGASDVPTLGQDGAGERIITAESGNLTLIRPGKQLWMNLWDAENHVWNPLKPDRYDLTRNATQRVLLPSGAPSVVPNALSKSFREMNLRELVAQERILSRRPSDRLARNIARIEIHKKFAYPFACIAFGVLGLPLGITNRRGGKSSGFSVSIAIIVFYYLLNNNGEYLAENGKIPAWLGLWAANFILLTAGLVLMARANRDVGNSVGIFARIGQMLRRLPRRTNPPMANRTAMHAPDEGSSGTVLGRFDITFPNLFDRYLLRQFLKVFGLVVISVAALTVIIDYTEIAKDAREHGIPATTLLTYYRFYVFSIVNYTLPISVLVATLVTLAILSKNNEVTALKASGVSLYRIGLPILVLAGVMCVFAYLNLDFILPYSTERVDAIKRRIDGKPPVSASAHQNVWFLGKDARYIINFLAYDRTSARLTQVQIFELHPDSFRIARRVYAAEAKWDGQGWVFNNGWIRSFPDGTNSTYTRIDRPIRLAYSETPETFATEVKPPTQMTYAQLSRYIASLRAAGYAADPLAVRLYEKTSWPLLSFVMALIALPFGFRMGRGGALYGIGLALVLGILYWVIFALFMKFGEVGNLPALLSAWAANILFGIAAAYMFLRVET